MNQVKFNFPKQPHLKSFKYEMARRKEKWKAINDPVERQLSIPPEAQPSVVRELVPSTCYVNLASMLDLPQLTVEDTETLSVETMIPYIPPDSSPEQEETQDSLMKRLRTSSQSTMSGSSASSQYESLGSTVLSKKSESVVEILSNQTEIDMESSEALSDFVEVEKKTQYDREMMLRHKAILRFLSLPEAEAASWRVKDAKDVSDLSEMTLEEKGDFLINKIAVDFCKWIRELGGDEKSFISEEIVKELFQIGMDNPASRAICMKTRERRVLYYNLAQFLQMPDKSFHEVLLKHLNWDAEVETKPSKLVAFGKCLPKNLRFKAPKNKTAETWLEWNKLSEEQLSFADVYKDIKDLRSTKEYCRWMAVHPEHKRPKYLVDQRMFEDPSLIGKTNDERNQSFSNTLTIKSVPSTRKTTQRSLALKSESLSRKTTKKSLPLKSESLSRKTTQKSLAHKSESLTRKTTQKSTHTITGIHKSRSNKTTSNESGVSGVNSDYLANSTSGTLTFKEVAEEDVVAIG